MNFYNYDHKVVLYCIYFNIQEQLYHKLLEVSWMFYHKDMVEVDCIQLDIFCIILYDKAIHIHVYHNLSFLNREYHKGDQLELENCDEGNKVHCRDDYHNFFFSCI